MKRFGILILVLAALPLVAQQPASKPAEKIVANINGEVVTQSQLDELYNSLNLQMRQQYERSGLVVGEAERQHRHERRVDPA